MTWLRWAVSTVLIVASIFAGSLLIVHAVHGVTRAVNIEDGNTQSNLCNQNEYSDYSCSGG
jgi:hypothetical protein